jgi:hypothetical protein
VAHSFLTSQPDIGEWLTSRSCRFTSGKEPRYALNRKLCGLHGLSEHLERRIIFAEYRGADKTLARPGRKQATGTEGFDVHISYL